MHTVDALVERWHALCVTSERTWAKPGARGSWCKGRREERPDGWTGWRLEGGGARAAMAPRVARG